MSGTNAHLILEQAPTAEEAPPATKPAAVAWVLSGTGPAAVGAAANALTSTVDDAVDVAYSLGMTRAALGHRAKFDAVATALAAAFESEHGIRLRLDGLSANEAASVERLVAEKYGTDAWREGRA